MPATGRRAEARVSPTPGEYEELRFSADGKSLFFKYAPRNEEIYNLPGSPTISWPGGAEDYRWSRPARDRWAT